MASVEHLSTSSGAPPAVEQTTKAATAAREQHVDPLNVSGAIDEQGNVLAFDYEALRQKFDTALIDEPLRQRFERVTGKKLHRLIRRGHFFSHRDLDKILDCYERGDTFFIYTGRGPSSDSMHLGHAIPFLFTKELQDIFDVPVVIMLTDDEKFQFRGAKEGRDLGEFLDYAYSNAKDIIAMGFDVKKTFIYSDVEFFGGHYMQNVTEFETLLTNNQVRGAMGFDGSTSIGMNSYPAKQCVAAFASSYPELFGAPDFCRPRPRSKGSFEKRPRREIAAIPCLIPCAIDQDPYFRLVRDNCHRMKAPSPKPALIHAKFLTALQGPGGKMSASDPTSAIFMSDTQKQIEKKINKYAFSGGRATKEEHEKYGGNPDVDVAYDYLTYFLEDDEELAQIRELYKAGTLSTGNLKKKCIAELQKFVGGFQDRRNEATDDVLDKFMTPRKMEYAGNPHPIKTEEAVVQLNGETTEEKPDRKGKRERKMEKLEQKKREKELEKLALRNRDETSGES
ncbi:hypothetical protein BJ546DRAFT_122631 [Cryomyces antarcticus]|nr:hypothetical protein LTR04_004241 [Oleoguttula sp. CCFEE 6159]